MTSAGVAAPASLSSRLGTERARRLRGRNENHPLTEGIRPGQRVESVSALGGTRTPNLLIRRRCLAPFSEVNALAEGERVSGAFGVRLASFMVPDLRVRATRARRRLRLPAAGQLLLTVSVGLVGGRCVHGRASLCAWRP